MENKGTGGRIHKLKVSVTSCQVKPTDTPGEHLRAEADTSVGDIRVNRCQHGDESFTMPIIDTARDEKSCHTREARTNATERAREEPLEV